MVVLLIAVGAVAAAAIIGLRGRETGTEAAYACPMHPEVRAAVPGECPICGMALEPIGREAAPNHRADALGVPDINAVENIRKHRIVDFVRSRALLAPLRELRGPAAVGDDGVLTAVFYNDQIQALASDEAGRFALTRRPGESVAVRRTSDPAVARDPSTSSIRFRVEPGGGRAPAAGDVGWIELEPKARTVLAVPASALLQSPEGPYVLAWAGGGRFEKRPIAIGETFLKHGFAVVLDGLKLHDRVVSRAAFFLDADRRLGAPLPPAAGDSEGAASDPRSAP